MFRRFREWVARFMIGRYGNDQLNRFLFGLYFALWILSMLFGGWAGLIIDMLATAAAVWLLFRMLSRNYTARQAENLWFLRWWTPTKKWFSHQFTRIKDVKRYRYRRCPGCKGMLRLPIKRGRRTVTCHHCRAQFQAFFL